MAQTLLHEIFSAKLESDHRLPIFRFEVPYDGGVTYGVLAPEVLFWTQLICIMLIEAAFGCIISALVYNQIVCRRGSTSSFLVGYGIVIPACLLFPYYLIATLDLRNKILKFAASAIVPNLTLFRCMEAMYGFSPPGTEKTSKQHMIYSASAMEICFDPKTGRPAPAKLSDTLQRLMHFMKYIVILGLYKSAFAPYGYEPFHEQISDDSMQRPWYRYLNVSHMGNNLIAAILLQLYLTAFCGGLIALTHLAGIKVNDVMKNPLFESTSPSEFWGKRWNILVNGVLKRGVFKPVRQYCSKPIAALATFVASGLFHEWILTAVFFVHSHEKDGDGNCISSSCYHPAYGYNLAFFLWNAGIIAMEHYIGGLYLFQWIKRTLPRPIITALVLSTALPVAHWFTYDLIKSDYFVHGQVGFPMIVKMA